LSVLHVLEAPQALPAPLGAHTELVDEREHGRPANTALGAVAAMPDGGKGALDRVGGADMRPMLGREVVEGEQAITVFDQALGGLGILGGVKSLQIA
jgi:hypothetical protein